MEVSSFYVPHESLFMARTMSRVVAASAALVLINVAGSAAADEESGVYVVANYGRAPTLFSRSDLDKGLTGASDGALTIESSSVEKHGTIGSAGVGYRMSANFAVEATYLDLGKIHYQASGTAVLSGTSYPSQFEEHTKSRGPALALVWALPLWNDWGVDARAGVYGGKTSSDLINTIGESEKPLSTSRRSTSLLLGIGGSYIATTHLTVRLDYVRLNDVKEKAFDKGFDVDVVTAGLAYHF
jgi:opacity protein-like surface antigen